MHILELPHLINNNQETRFSFIFHKHSLCDFSKALGTNQDQNFLWFPLAYDLYRVIHVWSKQGYPWGRTSDKVN